MPIAPSSFWPISDKGRALSFMILLFLEAAVPKEVTDKQDRRWLDLSLGNLLRIRCFSSELTTVKPVSTFVSASSFSELFSLLWTFMLDLTCRFGVGIGCWLMVVGLLSWDEQVEVPLEQARELSNPVLLRGSRSSREFTFILLPRHLRFLGSRVLP